MSGWAVVAASLVLTVVLALRLAATAMNPSLSSDVLYPHLFAQDVLAGRYPLSGWSFGGATFFFPDYLVYLPVLALTGPGGESFAVYAVIFFLALAALVAAVARWWADCRPLAAWLAGGLAVNGVLALQFLPLHPAVLWLFALPGYHGGTLLNGLALVALVGRILGRPRPGWLIWLAPGLLLWLGLTANALLFVQFVVPLAVAVGWLERQGAARAGTARRFALLGAGALAGAMFVRLGLELGRLGYYYRLGFRQTPTPAVLWHEAGKMARDVTADLAPHAWGWGAGLAAWLLLFAWAVRWRRRAPDPRMLALHYLVLVSAAGMTGVMIVTGFWKDWSNVRYLLNVLLLPVVVVAVALARSRAGGRLLPAPAAWVLAGSLLVAAGTFALNLPPAGWRFQPTPASGDLAAIIARHHLHQGLAGYWEANLLDGLDETHPLNALLADGHPYFWCNNAFWYFAPPAPDGALRWPVYDFILTAGLDREAVRARFGAPEEVVTEGAWEVFIYDAAGQERIRSLLAAEVVTKLGPARLRGLRPAFGQTDVASPPPRP